LRTDEEGRAGVTDGRMHALMGKGVLGRLPVAFATRHCACRPRPAGPRGESSTARDFIAAEPAPAAGL